MAERLGVSNSTVYFHLQQLGYVNKLDVWVPYELLEIQIRTQRINMCGGIHSLLRAASKKPNFWLEYLLSSDIEIGRRNQDKRHEMANSKEVMFLYDRSRPHTSITTCQKLAELNWELIPHPPYSLDLAPRITTCFALFKTVSMVNTTFNDKLNF